MRNMTSFIIFYFVFCFLPVFLFVCLFQAYFLPFTFPLACPIDWQFGEKTPQKTVYCAVLFGRSRAKTKATQPC